MRTSEASAGSWVLVAAAALWTPQAMAEIELPLDHDWYTIEVLIFEQSAGSGVPSAERLSTTAPRAYPANLLSPVLADANPGGGFAPLRATAEPWPEPPPPLPPERGAWFDEVEVDPQALPVNAIGNAVDEAETAAEAPIDERAGESLIEAPEPLPTPRQLLEKAAAEALAEFKTTLAGDSYRWRSDPTQLGLAAEAAALTRHGVGRTVVHGAWLQPVPERGSPQPILIQSDEAIADRWRIEGTLAITLGRFLHVAAELWYQPDHSSTQGAAGAQRSAAAGGWFQLTDDTSQDTAVLAGIPFDFDDAVDPELPYQVLSERRRMRSGELHYLDHPSFGVLIRVTPLEPPAALLELFEQLEEAVE